MRASVGYKRNKGNGNYCKNSDIGTIAGDIMSHAWAQNRNPPYSRPLHAVLKSEDTTLRQSDVIEHKRSSHNPNSLYL